jgi:non-canonical poly(A) RNA polymerase PAPD5/7
MADTSAFATGDDFISFDFGAPPSPGAGPSRSASPASSAIGDGDILDGLTRSPPRGWKGKARADDGNGDASPVADSRASPAHDSRPSSPRLGKKRKSNGVEPDTKRPKADPYGTGPRNLKEERRAAERAAPWADDVRWDRCVDSAEM